MPNETNAEQQIQRLEWIRYLATENNALEITTEERLQLIALLAH